MPGLRTTKRCNRSLSRQSPTLGLDGINTLLSLSRIFFVTTYDYSIRHHLSLVVLDIKWF